MKNSVLIAWHDLRHQLRQGSTLLWLLIMPPVFFYFIGSVTGGFSSPTGNGAGTPLVVEASSPGFVAEQIERRLEQFDFDPEWREPGTPRSKDQPVPSRLLTFSPRLSERVLAGESVEAHYDTRASSLSREYEIIRIYRAVYTVLADLAAASAQTGGALDEEALRDLNEQPRQWRLDVQPAGKRETIPTGFEQSIPGILVMFTLLVLLTSGASMLAIEREKGLLRRLASAPITRAELVAGKWLGRMGLAVIQVGVALAIGTFAFKMDWGPDFAMVLLVLLAWAAFCASAGLLLGNLARSENQAVGLGVLLANVLAALGGCWWPIEITPGWMQSLQNLLPTGWAMDGLHRLVSFEAGAASALPQICLLLASALILAWVSARTFRYQ